LVYFEGDDVAPVEEDGIDSTAVVDIKSGLLYVFEMGWDYIILKTVMGLAPPRKKIFGKLKKPLNSIIQRYLKKYNHKNE